MTPIPRSKTRRRMIRRALSLAMQLLLICGFVARMASAQQSLPISIPSATLNTLSSEVSGTIDLGSLPNRPALVIEVTPDPGHPDMELEIELSGWVGNMSGPGACWSNTDAYFSTPAVGANTLEHSFIGCQPIASFWAGKTVDVIVRPVDFGSNGAPANVAIEVRGETRVPTSTLIQQVMGPRTVALVPTKDTVLYDSDDASSNGAGAYLWAGTDHFQIFLGGSTLTFRYRLNSLLAFDIVSTLPANALVTNADLELFAFEVLNGGGGVSVYETGLSSSGDHWLEGNANAAGTEFFGTTSTWNAANWDFRRELSSLLWTTPGGDIAGGALASLNISSTGYKTFSSSALDAVVQDMVDRQDDADGFTLRGPGGILVTSDRAVRFASREYGSSFFRPTMTIDYYQPEPYGSGAVNSGVVNFIGEGEDFRWVYDDDDDGIFVTEIQGICEVVPDFPGQSNSLPYTYSYAGAPGYTGLDCCTWQIDSSQTGTVGAGQALFFHNLDPGDPANLPPDYDDDGILNGCDNCLYVPNGPALGSCVGPGGLGASCHSDLECGAGELCQLAQEDVDSDSEGDACPVPEPGAAVGLAAGGTLLALLARRRR